MRLLYIGTHDVVRVPLPFGGEILIKKNEAKDFPDTLAKRLLEQPENWLKKKKGAK